LLPGMREKTQVW